MSISGNLKTMELSELLQWLSQSKKTGTLIIDNGEVKKQILFEAGRIVFSASTDPKEHLGHFLVSHGFINEVELANAIQMQEQTKMLLGKILVSIGAIAEEDLDRLLKLKAEESIYDIFSWIEGEFRFLDGELPENSFIPMSLDVTGLVLEGVQRLDEWKRIRGVVRSRRAIPVAMTDDLASGEKLSPGEQQILALVDDQRTVEEICLQTHSSEFHVSKVLFDQLQKRRLKVVNPRSRAEPQAPTAESNGVDARSLVKRAGTFLGHKDYEQALRHLRAARSLEPHEKEIQTAVAAGEKGLTEALQKEGMTLSAVPVLAADIQELTASKISPQEGFMLTRINGSYDIASIIKISPMPQLDALLVFWRLLQEGHIELKGK